MKLGKARCVLSVLLMLAVLVALPGMAYAAPPVAGTPVPEGGEEGDTPVTVEAMPDWGAPMTVRSWYGLRLREGPGLSERIILILRNGPTRPTCDSGQHHRDHNHPMRHRAPPSNCPVTPSGSQPIVRILPSTIAIPQYIPSRISSATRASYFAKAT